MASLSFTSSSFRPPELSFGNGNYGNTFKVHRRKKSISVPFAANSPEESLSVPPEKPEIELDFIGPKSGNDGSYPVEKAKAISGEKLLRNIMLDNKIELYATYIIDGKDLLNERTNTELRYLKKKPESWRLACQTIVGNKENSGKVVVQRIPQWKK
ncbi:hypothetical protein F2P56_017562 [Juglans regia]|uniref:Photosynthetic NDH subunit of subcomplex B 3, chloroplastic n=2 Tax=Juglans regia TaxID=51240 RepID=A0A833U4F2_JUGRE|nr:photosynthetic NDH subunit of subcomplex B 3, chloroplastic isoform X2 [Juglans regia]KAF5461465.1 hypothetical protein F2P56_017562 [Juglans regia]